MKSDYYFRDNSMSRLFEEFQKKNTVPKVSKISTKSTSKDIVIAIPLKSNADKKTELDDNFVKAIEYEYAVKYLEIMGIYPTPKMIATLLQNHPLSSCELMSGWSKTGWLADVIYIHPRKNMKTKPPGQPIQINLNQRTMAKSSTQRDLLKGNKNDMTDKQESSNQQNDVSKSEEGKEDNDKGTDIKKKEINMDPMYWKNKFLFPYIKKESVASEGGEPSSPTINSKSKPKNNIIDNPDYKFPLNKLSNNIDVLNELQNPLQITIEEIIIDLQKIVRGFPVESIPHTVGEMVVDKVHNFNRIEKSITKIPKETIATLFPNNPAIIKKFESSAIKSQMVNKPNLIAKPLLSRDDIKAALFEIDSENFARFVGIMAHLIYWTLFGDINQVPLDELHK